MNLRAPWSLALPLPEATFISWCRKADASRAPLGVFGEIKRENGCFSPPLSPSNTPLSLSRTIPTHPHTPLLLPPTPHNPFVPMVVLEAGRREQDSKMVLRPRLLLITIVGNLNRARETSSQFWRKRMLTRDILTHTRELASRTRGGRGAYLQLIKHEMLLRVTHLKYVVSTRFQCKQTMCEIHLVLVNNLFAVQKKETQKNLTWVHAKST